MNEACMRTLHTFISDACVFLRRKDSCLGNSKVKMFRMAKTIFEKEWTYLGPVCPMFRSEIPAPEMPLEAGPRVSAAERLSRRSLSASESANDDLREVQLGDVLIEDNRTTIAVFGSKCYRGGAGKSVALPAASEPGSGANLLADSVR